MSDLRRELEQRSVGFLLYPGRYIICTLADTKADIIFL